MSTRQCFLTYMFKIAALEKTSIYLISKKLTFNSLNKLDQNKWYEHNLLMMTVFEEGYFYNSFLKKLEFELSRAFLHTQNST